MTMTRAVAVIALAGLVAAVAVAVASRTPASIRDATPPPDATDPALGAHFTDEQIARHGAYRAPSYLATGLGIALEVVVLVALAREVVPRVFDATRGVPGGWVVQGLILVAVVIAVLWVARLPLSYVRGHAMQHAWGLSTQDVWGWFADRAKGVGVSLVIAGVMVVAFFGIVRWQPRAWWVFAWAAFTALTAFLMFIYPVAIAPLFHNFTPLDDESLEQRIGAMAGEAGIDIDEVLVADASRRTTAENAYVAGLGATKQVVLYDNLLEAGAEDDIAFVVAHELGHRAENHVVKNVAVASAGFLVAFAALAWLARSPGLWAWASAQGIADLRAIPVLLLFATVFGVVSMPVANGVSRAFERQADDIAIELTGEVEPAVAAFRRLAFSNIADLRPPRAAVWLLYTHPPTSERIARLEARVEEIRRAP